MLQSHCKTENVRGEFLKILPTARDIGAFLRAFRDTVRKISFFRELIWGLGGKTCPPNFFRAYISDLELNVDYDFAIKHDPIQSDD